MAPRSGLSVKHGLDVLGGVIDEDYTGDISVILINHSDKQYVVARHERIGQLIVEHAEIVPIIQVDALPETDRGSKGFGSTGRK